MVVPAKDRMWEAGEGHEAPPRPLLTVRGLTLRFRGLVALDEVGLEVRERQIHALIGPNGAGKTSLLNCIVGVYRPQSGSIRYRGRELTRMSPGQVARLGVARTFQNLELFRGLSVLDNVKLGADLRFGYAAPAGMLGLRPARARELAIREQAERALDYLDLTPYRSVPAGSLPYGIQKRVELARALASRPELLLLDEPMAGLNVEEKEDLARYILDVRDELGATVLLVEHDLRVVMDLSDRITVLSYGRTIAEGTPADVATNAEVRRAYTGVST